MARSMLTTEETRLKSKSLALPVNSSSSSPMILLVESGSCRFSNACKFVHDASMNAKSSNSGGSQTQGTNTKELIVKLLGQLGLTNTLAKTNGT
ncbi:hypothetical protein Tco_1473607 [Tanacetum coccineum]